MRIAAALMAAAFLSTGHAQEKRPSLYKVEFDVRAAGDDAARHFAMFVEEAHKGIFQKTDRIPVAGASPGYVDVGVKIQCTVQESAGKAALSGEIEITSIKGVVMLGAISQPIIGQRKLAFHTTVPLNLPSAIVDGTGPAPANYQVEATVTKVN